MWNLVPTPRQPIPGDRPTCSVRHPELVEGGPSQACTSAADAGVGGAARFPYIFAQDDDYGRRGELYLQHSYEGTELDSGYLRHTLIHLQHIWQRPVRLATVENDQPVVYTCSGPREVGRKAG